MNLINTGVISSANDIFWKDIPGTMLLTPKPVLIIINEYEPGSADDTQLGRMMAASKITPDLYNVMQVVDGGQLAWHQLRDQLKPKIVFLIGIIPVQLGISVMFKLHLPNNFNGCTFIPTFALSDLRKNDDARQYLWENRHETIFLQITALFCLTDTLEEILKQYWGYDHFSSVAKGHNIQRTRGQRYTGVAAHWRRQVAVLPGSGTRTAGNVYCCFSAYSPHAGSAIAASGTGNIGSQRTLGHALQ